MHSGMGASGNSLLIAFIFLVKWKARHQIREEGDKNVRGLKGNGKE
jgi:hypothetical protein